MAAPLIEIVGLGPAGEEYVTEHTRRRIAAHGHRYLRTAQHPSASVVADAIALDHHYEDAATFDETYRGIVAELISAAQRHGEILYAVPGSPLVLERTVRDLLVDVRVRCVVQPAMSFLDLVWSRLGIDPVESAVTLIDGHQFASAAAGAAGPLLVAHCHAPWVLSEIKLSTEDTDSQSNDDIDVVVLHHLGLEDEVVATVPWSAMDRTVDADHLTSVYIPQLRVNVGQELVAFHELARRLRHECPWDREQTHQSLITYLLEETYEVVDALDALDADDPRSDEHLVEELGDLLYQIEFHAAIAEQEGRFTMADVARSINDKLVRRHPHVFGAVSTAATDAESLATSWEAIKMAEKEAKGVRPGPFDGVPRSTGALSYAASIQKRADRAGIDLGIAPSGLDLDAVTDLGDVLFSIVADCRRRGIDPEVALRSVTSARRAAAEGRFPG
ncbi:MAG: MazG family protein [Ilumatobacteraceae bacterium]